MRKTKQPKSTKRVDSGLENVPVDSEFYTGSPTERPLFQDKPVSESQRVRKTGRHQAAQGRRKEAVDPREKLALLAILKSTIIILLLVITFFALRTGVKLYEERILLATQGTVETSPVMREVALVEDFDIGNTTTREIFIERIEIWKNADRLVRSADDLMKRDNIDQAIVRCQDALRQDPTHNGALERLSNLYYVKGMTAESINSYIRLLSADPSREDFQEKLIQVLDIHGDADAVVFMAKWFLEQNHYDSDVQRYLANALYLQEEFSDAVIAYERVLKDDPRNFPALEKLAKSYMHLEDYEAALEALDKLRINNYRDQNYYRQIAVCNAQLGLSSKTVQTLGKAANLFGKNVVVGWIRDPRLDPIREDRIFQAFTVRIGGEKFKMWLDKVAKTIEEDNREEAAPQVLNRPKNEQLNADLLKAKQ